MTTAYFMAVLNLLDLLVSGYSSEYRWEAQRTVCQQSLSFPVYLDA
jgi:hypothetical protein